MAAMKRPVHVVGVGMIPFTKPGASAPYHEMGQQAARAPAVLRDPVRLAEGPERAHVEAAGGRHRSGSERRGLGGWVLAPPQSPRKAHVINITLSLRNINYTHKTVS